MKHLLSLILGITLAVYGSVAMADDTTTIWVTKEGDSSAKICTASKCLGTVPVKFVDDATWSTAKDSYDVAPATAAAIATKGACITVHGDGGISVSTTACKAPKKK
jgi:hypothetical protein